MPAKRKNQKVPAKIKKKTKIYRTTVNGPKVQRKKNEKLFTLFSLYDDDLTDPSQSASLHP